VQGPTPASIEHASKRLGIVLDNYTVYCDLAVCDLAGRVLAHARPKQFPQLGKTVMTQHSWFGDAVADISRSAELVAARLGPCSPAGPPQLVPSMSAGKRIAMVVVVAWLWARQGVACPDCPTARLVRARLCGQRVGWNLVVIAAPLAILVGVAWLLRALGRPRRETR
jgi:hypothetical protein